MLLTSIVGDVRLSLLLEDVVGVKEDDDDEVEADTE